MFCPNCGNQYEGNPRFCENCGLTLGQSRSEGPTGPRFMDWFRYHLNWTLVIAGLLINAASFIAGFLAAYYIADEDAYYGVFWFIFVFNIILTAVAAGWVLNQKGRGLLWLLLTPFWIGWIVWLALDNRSQAPVSRGVGLTKNTYRCRTCGTENGRQARFCQGCGASLEEQYQESTAATAIGGRPKFCTWCGHQNSTQARHCENCGKALASLPKKMAVNWAAIDPRLIGVIALAGGILALVGLFSPWAYWEAWARTPYLSGSFTTWDSGSFSAWDSLTRAQGIGTALVPHAYDWLALVGTFVVLVWAIFTVVVPRIRGLWLGLALGGLLAIAGTAWASAITQVEPHASNIYDLTVSYSRYGLFLTMAGGVVGLMGGILGLFRGIRTGAFREV